MPNSRRAGGRLRLCQTVCVWFGTVRADDEALSKREGQRDEKDGEDHSDV